MSAKFAVQAFSRIQAFRYGLKKKSAQVSTSYAYSYLERGTPSNEKPSLVLIHGFSSNKYHFLVLSNFLPRDRHVILLDLPGHGDTPEKDDVSVMSFVQSIHEFVEFLGMDKKKFHLVGTSMGGQIVGVYAKEYPEHLASVTLACPAGIYYEKQIELIEKARSGEKVILLPETMDDMKHLLDHLMFKKPKIPDIIVKGMLQMRLEHQDYYRKLGLSLADPENLNLLEKELANIQVPVLVVWGKEDNLLPVECVDTIEKKLPTPPKTVVFDEIGHGMMLECPKEFNEVLQEFMSSLDK